MCPECVSTDRNFFLLGWLSYRQFFFLSGTTALEEWGEFLHAGGRVFKMDEIRHEIEKETIKLAGVKKNISHDKITLKVFSPRVPNLTLVDLPGITKVRCVHYSKRQDLLQLPAILSFTRFRTGHIRAETGTADSIAVLCNIMRRIAYLKLSCFHSLSNWQGTLLVLCLFRLVRVVCYNTLVVFCFALGAGGGTTSRHRKANLRLGVLLHWQSTQYHSGRGPRQHGHGRQRRVETGQGSGSGRQSHPGCSHQAGPNGPRCALDVPSEITFLYDLHFKIYSVIFLWSTFVRKWSATRDSVFCKERGTKFLLYFLLNSRNWCIRCSCWESNTSKTGHHRCGEPFPTGNYGREGNIIIR